MKRFLALMSRKQLLRKGERKIFILPGTQLLLDPTRTQRIATHFQLELNSTHQCENETISVSQLNESTNVVL